MNESQLATELGLGIGGHARFGVVDVSLSTDFLTRSMSNAYSVSAVYSAYYNEAPEKLDSTTLSYTPVGTSVKSNYERWPITCGDSFVDEVRKGARLYVSIRVDFSSARQQQEFSSHFSISGPLAGAEVSLHTASQRYGQNVKVTVSALQRGGDETKITKLFGDSDAGRQAYTECTLGTFESCAKIIQSLLKYAGDTTDGFPSQLSAGAKPGPATLAYVVSPYTAYGIYSAPHPLLPAAVELSRQELSKQFEKTYRQFVTASRLLDTKLANERRTAIQLTLEQLKRNISLELKTSKTCYESPELCPDAVLSLKLETVDDDILLPDSFSTLCVQSLTEGPQDPLPTTISALINIVDRGGRPKDQLDCRIYERLLNHVAIFVLRNEQLTDISPLAGFVNVERLDLSGNRIEDISSLMNLSELEYLNLSSNKIKDLAPLDRLFQLRVLGLAGNRIQKLDPLKTLELLTSVSVASNQLVSIEPLAALPRLEYIDAHDNNINDLAYMKTPLRLTCIDVSKNLLTETQIGGFQNLFPHTVIGRKEGDIFHAGGVVECSPPVPSPPGDQSVNPQ